MEDNYVSYQKLTKYELAALIGARADALSRGFDDPKVPIQNPKNIRINWIEIAEEELAKGVLPLLLRRKKISDNEVDEVINPNELV